MVIIFISFSGLSFESVFVEAILSTLSIPLITCQKTECTLSNPLLSFWLIKNWLPFVFAQAFAIDILPLIFFSFELNSSSNSFPYILSHHIQVPVGSHH
jgi:hypothetical protein